MANEEWKKEQQRILTIQAIIEDKVGQIDENLSGVKGDVLELRKHFWDDVTVNFDESDDLGETFTSIKQQVELLAERERTHGLSNKERKELLRLQDSPYFGRIDFHEEGEAETDRVYIGVASLMDQNNEEFLIYDWRAPISSLYYDYSPGPASYMTPSGLIEGEMELKRQYIIKNDKLIGMFDTGITIGDSLLKEVLGGNANTQMKSIVATIQREQNHIIRNEKSRILIVQGAAGSGKTSAALQRVAYLLYRYRKSISADNILLFSPNPLFNSYVATVLPELGEENMEQTTFQQYLETRLGKHFRVEDPYSQLEYILTSRNEPEYEARLAGIRYKTSHSFKKRIDEYVQYLSSEGLLFKNIKFRGKMLISADEMKTIFYSLDPAITIANRMRQTVETMLRTLTKLEKQERKKEWVAEEIELLDQHTYREVYKQIERENHPNDDRFTDAEREEELLAKAVVRKYFKSIRAAVKQLKIVNMKMLYVRLFSTEFPFTSPEGWDAICEDTLSRLQSGHMPYEDATPYLYLQDKIEGRKSNTLIRHLFIDEAQDYSPFQFEYMRQLFPNAKMTILGDINQSIYLQSDKEPSLLELEGEERMVLTRSYRSTQQIVEFTKPLIEGGEQIEPFNREGPKPIVTVVPNEESLTENVVERIRELQEHGHGTIAVICQTGKESATAYERLKGQLPIRMLDKKTSTFEKGIVVLPSYLAKGIEFDAVIIYNAAVYGEEEERKLFYTACTRAMHELHLYSVGKLSPFMEQIPKELYVQR